MIILRSIHVAANGTILFFLWLCYCLIIHLRFKEWGVCVCVCALTSGCKPYEGQSGFCCVQDFKNQTQVYLREA